MPGGEPAECVNNALDVLSNRQIAGHQIRVAVGERDRTIHEPIVMVQVEEDRAAAEKGFPVPSELSGVEAPKLGKELALAAGPFQERPYDGGARGRGSLGGHGRCG
jgi:hypothetical protein